MQADIMWMEIVSPSAVRSLARLGLLVGATACGPTQEPNIVDLVDGYHAFRDAVHDATPETRLAAFRTHLLDRDPAFASAFMGWVDRYAAEHPEHLDGMIQAALAQDEGIRIYHELLHDTVPTVARDVAAHLDESVYDVPVYLTMSVLSSTAQVRRVEGRPVIMYGLGTLAFFDAQTPSAAPMADLRPLVAHEYFHAWHWTVNPFMGDAAEGFLPPQPDAPVWLNLWSEGLATCFSRILYPEASIQHHTCPNWLLRIRNLDSIQFAVSAPSGVRKPPDGCKIGVPGENGLAPGGGEPVGNLDSIREVPGMSFSANRDRPVFSMT